MPGDQVEAGGRIEAAAEVLVNALFSPFRDLNRSPTPAELNLFVHDLFENAAATVEEFCLRYALAMRSETVLDAVRAEPAAVLAHEIRTTIFKQVDRYIDSYRRSEAEVGAQIAKLDDDLEDTSVAASAVVGAAVGQAAGGFGKSGGVLGTVAGAAEASRTWARQNRLLTRAALVKDGHRVAAVDAIEQFVCAVRSSAVAIVDYGFAKCFGSRANRDVRSAAMGRILDVCDAEIANGSQALAANLDRQRIHAQREETVHEENAAAIHENALAQTNRFFGAILIGLGLLFVFSGICCLFTDLGPSLFCIGAGILMIRAGRRQRRKPPGRLTQTL